MQIMVGNWRIINVCWWIRVKVTYKSHSVHPLASHVTMVIVNKEEQLCHVSVCASLPPN